MALIWHRMLVAAALALWGCQTRFYALASLLAAATVLAVYSRWRLAFSAREFARLWDATLLLLFGAGIYHAQTSSVSAGVLGFLQWLPVLLYPFVAAFFFSGQSRLPASTFLFWWRKAASASDRGLDITYPYLAVCLLSASTTSALSRWFYPATTLLIAVALWINRPRRARPAVAIVLLLALAALGYSLQSQWREFQNELESKSMGWFSGFFPRQFEDQETHTNLGEIGKLKQSGRVVMRVRGPDVPHLLRQVTFNQYRRGIWLSTRRQYAGVTERQAGTWELAATPDATNSTALTIPVPEGKILLPLPLGAARVRQLLASRLELNRFGNVRVWDAPDPVECSVDFNPARAHEAPPDHKDLQVAYSDEPALEMILGELGLKVAPRGGTRPTDPSGQRREGGRPAGIGRDAEAGGAASLPPGEDGAPAVAIERLKEFFRERFHYAPAGEASAFASTNADQSLREFLLETRRGHCEYFATTGVLLLRKAGIPARYATGYAVVEAAERGTFQVRERHAHSWVLAYVDGKWQDFDPTPEGWSSIDLRQSSTLRPLSDWWAEARFRFATQRWLPELNGRIVLMVLVPPVAAGLLWIVMKRKPGLRRRQFSPKSLAHAYAWPGTDSDLFAVQEALARRGLGRHPEETAAAWVRRITEKAAVRDGLAALVRLHYKYRFDPEGLSIAERDELATTARAWLANHRS